MYKLRFIVHLENKEVLTGDWEDGVTDHELQTYAAMLNNLVALKSLKIFKNGRDIYIHPGKFTHVEIEFEDADQNQDEQPDVISGELGRSKRQIEIEG